MITTLSCQSYTYEYETGLREYFHNELNINNLNTNYYFIQVSNCNSCHGDKLNINYLINHNLENITIIIVGDSEKVDVVEGIKKLKQIYPVIIDQQKEIYQYQTGFSKTLLVLANNNKLINVLHINDTKINQLSNLLK